MKVVLLAPTISRRGGGVTNAVLGLARSLQDQGDFEVHVLSVQNKFGADSRALRDSVSVEVFDSLLNKSFAYAPALANGLDRLQPDAVHTHGLWTYLSVVANRWSRAERPRRPYAVSPHGMLEPWALRNAAWKKRIAAFAFERRHLMRASCLHAINDAEVLAIRHFGLRNPICVIPNGVDLSIHSIQSKPPWDGTITKQRKILLYLGRIHPKKGLPSLLRAWADTRAIDSAWMLVIAGWDQGGHESDLQRLASDLEITDSVHFCGPLFDLKREAAYACVDAFVLPSLSEGQPLVVLEAWSHRVPVLMTGECNLPEGFAAGAAIKMEPTTLSITEALRKLGQMSQAELLEMGVRGRALVAAKFSWPEIGRQMASVYRWLVGDAEQPACVTTE